MNSSLALTPAAIVETDEPPVCRADEPPSCLTSDESPSTSTLDESTSCTLSDLSSFTLQSETALELLLAQRQTPNWQDWHWQMRNRIRTVQQLIEFFPDMKSQVGLPEAAGKFPLSITPYYASLIQKLDETDPVFLMSVPQIQELYDPPFLKNDPLEEDEDMPVPGLVHRYQDRALVIATSTCSMYCRHCTRKRIAGARETCITSTQLEQVSAYLADHPEIHDVVVSGGDPLTMATPALERVLQAIRSVASVDIIRIGTRTPVVMPQRITPELVRMLRKYHPVWINTHFNHPNEITAESRAACERLVDAGIPVGNQSVLLRGVNDSPVVMERLLRGLVRMRVRPYYMFQCDLVRGVEHFRTPISRGIEIMEYLRGRLSGLAIPTYVVDAPHGGGKIPVLPNYVVSSSPTHTVLRNFEGMIVNYPEPRGVHYSSVVEAHGADAKHVSGVCDLASGRASSLVPANSARHKRREMHHTPHLLGLDA